MPSKKPTPGNDAAAILRKRYVDGQPHMAALVEEERANARIARAIYDLRQRLGLSQRQLAARVGTTASVICQLEDADYTGHSSGMLERIAAACGQKLVVEVRFVPEPGLRSSKPAKAKKTPA